MSVTEWNKVSLHVSYSELPRRPILDRGLRLKSAKAAKLCGKLLRHVLKALTGTYVRESCTLTSEQRATWETDPVGLFRQWGNSPDVTSDELAVDWHVASGPELAFATELIKLFYRPAVHTLSQFVAGRLEYRHDVLLNALMAVRNFTRVGIPVLPEITDPADDLYTAPESDGSSSSTSFMARVKVQLDVLPPEFVELHRGNRPELMTLTHNLVDKLLDTCEDDTKLFKLTIKIAFQLLCVRGITDRKHSRQTKVWSWLKQGSADLVRPGKRYSRAMLLRRIDMQHQRRKNKGRVSIPYTISFQQILRDLIKLSASRSVLNQSNVRQTDILRVCVVSARYAVVRKRAQNVVSHVTSTHPIARHDVFESAVALLDVNRDDMETKHQQIKGALFMLCSKSISRLVMQHPRYAARLAKQSLVLEGNDRPSIQTQVNHLFGYVSFQTPLSLVNSTVVDMANRVPQILEPRKSGNEFRWHNE